MRKIIQNLSSTKNYLVAALMISLSLFSQSANAQFGKKLKAKMQKVAKQLEEGSFLVRGMPASDVSQAITAANFKNGTYNYWMSNGSSSAGSPNGKKKLEIIKKDGKAVEIMYDGNKYVPDQHGKSDFVRYWKTDKIWIKLFFTKDRIFLLNVSEPDGASWKGMLIKQAPYEYIPAIEKYLKESKQHQLADLEAYEKKKAAKAAADAAERKRKYSIEGKDVVSIKMVNFKKSEFLSNFDASWSFDIEAKLKDGTTISTANGGFRSDYKITDENAPIYKPHHNIVYPMGMKVKTGFVKGDKIIVKVASKYNSSIKTKKEIVLNYKHNKGRIYFSRSANRWGYSAEDLELKIKKVKHAITGEELYQYRLTSLSINAIIAEGKISSSQRMLITSNGYQGKPYNNYVQQTSRGGDGGNGGNITIIKDPNISSLDGFIQTKNTGGRPGKGKASYLDGRSGRDGTVKTITKSVTF